MCYLFTGQIIKSLPQKTQNKQTNQRKKPNQTKKSLKQTKAKPEKAQHSRSL